MESNSDCFDFSASSKSKSSWIPNQNFAEFPKNFENRSAVSAVILRFPWMISDILVWGRCVSFARRYAEIPKGLINSSFKISPGWIFLRVSIVIFNGSQRFELRTPGFLPKWILNAIFGWFEYWIYQPNFRIVFLNDLMEGFLNQIDYGSSLTFLVFSWQHLEFR